MLHTRIKAEGCDCQQLVTASPSGLLQATWAAAAVAVRGVGLAAAKAAAAVADWAAASVASCMSSGGSQSAVCLSPGCPPPCKHMLE